MTKRTSTPALPPRAPHGEQMTARMTWAACHQFKRDRAEDLADFAIIRGIGSVATAGRSDLVRHFSALMTTFEDSHTPRDAVRAAWETYIAQETAKVERWAARRAKKKQREAEKANRAAAARRKCRALDPIEMVTIAARAELATYGTRQPVTLPTAPASVTM